MRLKTLAALAALAVASLFTPVVASDLATVTQATYKLYDGHSPADGMCSATFIGNAPDGALFLTAAHCVDGSANLNIREDVLEDDLQTILSSQVTYLRAVKTLKEKDIAVLITRASDFRLDIAVPDRGTVEDEKALYTGQPVAVIGYPAGAYLTVTDGYFTSRIPPILGLKNVMYQTSAPVFGGNSGGGLYRNNGGDYTLIGVTTAMRRDNAIMTYYQSITTIHEALRGIKFEGADGPEIQPVNDTIYDPQAYKREGAGRTDAQ